MKKGIFTILVGLLFGFSGYAQFNLASDDAVLYSNTWNNGDNNGFGFEAWNITAGANTGVFIGDPASNGMDNSNIGDEAFGLYATGSAYLNASRSFSPLGVGQSLIFYWAMNWDASTGSKGIDFKANSATIININNAGDASITWTNGTISTDYGTNPMLIILKRTSTDDYSLSVTRRNDGGGTFTDTFSSTAAIDEINLYIGNQNDGDANRNIYFNHFTIEVDNWADVPDGAEVEILQNVTLPANKNLLGLLITNAAYTFDLNGFTLSFANTGYISNSGTFIPGTGKVVFDGAGTVFDNAITFYDVEINGGVNFGTSSTLNGTLEIKDGGFVDTNPPAYANGSTLKYSTTGDYGSGAEWTAGSLSTQGVPYNVTIETTNPLRITGTSYKHLRGNLTITPGTEFQLSPDVGGDLSLAGNFTDNGTFTHNSRLVTFNGSATQTIGGTATTAFGFLTVAADAIVEVPAGKNITVDNNFVMAAAKESKAAGQFTLQSDATGTASLITKGGVSGEVKVERFLTGGWAWHFLSSPVVDQPIVGAANFIEFSFGTNSDEGDPNVDFYRFDETNTTNAPWINIKDGDGTINESFGTPSTAPLFEEGLGYLVAYNGSDVTKTFTGEPFTGPLLVDAFHTPTGREGWNLIGNPYPSAIDWEEGNITKSGLASNYYYIYNQAMNAGGGGYEYYKDFGSPKSAGANGDIPAMQAFFVEAGSGGGQVTLSNNARKHSTQEFYKTELQNENFISFAIQGADYHSRSQVYIREGAAIGRDENDAAMLYSLNSAVPHFYSVDGNRKMVANAVPFPDEDYTIPMGLKTGAPGTYTITAEDIQHFTNSVAPILEDTQTGAEVDLRFESSYTFDVAEAGINHSRFILHLKSAVGINDPNQKLQLAVTQVGNELRLYNVAPGEYQLRMVDIVGRVVMEKNISNSGSIRLPDQIQTGHYIIQLIGKQTHQHRKILIY